MLHEDSFWHKGNRYLGNGHFTGFFKGLISLIFPAHTIPVSLFLLKSNVRTPWAYTRDIGLTIQFLQFPLTTQEMDPRQCWLTSIIHEPLICWHPNYLLLTSNVDSCCWRWFRCKWLQRIQFVILNRELTREY